MVRFNKWQKIMMVAMPLAITMNPLTVEIFLDWYKLLFTGISVLAVTYIVLFTLYSVFKPQPVNIPKKGKKSVVKSKEYLDKD